MRLLFIGSNQVKLTLQEALKDHAEIFSDIAMLNNGNIDICICELSDSFGSSKIPANTIVPIFVYINTRSKDILDSLKNYRISGILQPPINSIAFMSKAQTIIKTAVPDGVDFDKIKIKILAKAESIPMLPRFVDKLITMTGKGVTEGSIDDVSREIRKDQGISGRVIRMVNSSFFGLRQQVNSIDRAIVLLGFQAIKSLALAASAGSYYNKQFAMYNSTGPVLWQHAYTTALIAEMLASELGMDTDSLYLAGLFHDIGKTIMVDFLVQEVASAEDERRQLGIDHAEVAWLVVRRWKLSEDICTAIRHHHMRSTGEPDASMLLHYANLLAKVITADNSELSLMYEVADKLRLTNEGRVQIMARLDTIYQASEVQI
ncbi:MAG: HDOD domain-containing protein [Deferribacteraceae bacterium]|jgi:putative nucleotidyltransferase with HDIG domain|nr:HDOD domain-containing protein [Deferribacteraceae bacterium]